MSELMNAQNSSRDFRWQLLTTVSALALLAAVYGSSESKAADQDADRPTVWIELGGQMEHVGGQGDAFTPPFLAANPKSPVLQSTTPLQAQNPVPFGFGEEGRISFQPENSDWVFSAAARIGRSSNFKHVDHQTNRVFDPGGNGTPITVEDFADTKVQHRESAAILDFSAGKDIGLGLFGRESSSTVSLGVRFAQFTSKETFNIRARPDLYVNYKYQGPAKFPTHHFHNYYATGHATRSFHGLGPSISWNGATPFVGNTQGGEIALDWGINAAILFGRQKARVQHQESGHYEKDVLLAKYHYYTVYAPSPRGHVTDRFVTVPNVGGTAGISFRRGIAKISLGYRADFFFGAMDGGIDAVKKENIGFYGPFASVSVGIGG